VYSNTIFLSCLARNAQNTLTCKHSICDPCTVMHGCTPLTEPWSFSPTECPLCGSSNDVVFRLKPYAAGDTMPEYWWRKSLRHHGAQSTRDAIEAACTHYRLFRYCCWKPLWRFTHIWDILQGWIGDRWLLCLFTEVHSSGEASPQPATNPAELILHTWRRHQKVYSKMLSPASEA